jgi:lysozyme
MNTSSSAVAQIAQFEGIRLVPYNDVAGNATVGVGHLLHRGPLDGTEVPVTEVQALSMFSQDIVSRAEVYVDQFVKVSLNQNQFDALVSFTYNLGVGLLVILLSDSGLNLGQYENVPQHLILYNKARVNGVLTVEPGLVKRRQWEVSLWNTPVDV